MKSFNPRGYAYKKIRGAYRYQQRWDWPNLLTNVDDYPREGEFIDACLSMFDRMIVGRSLTPDTVREVVDEILHHYTRSLSKSISGVLKRSTDRTFRYAYGLHLDTPLPSGEGYVLDRELAYVQPEYAEVETQVTVESWLDVVADFLPARELDILTRFVFEGTDFRQREGSLKGFALEAGFSENEYVAMMNRMRRTCKKHLRLDGDSLVVV